jgi:hypothetical protein
MTAKLRRCPTCRKFKKPTDFYKNSYRKHGCSAYCKECARERSRKWRSENPQKQKATQVKWRKANPEKVREISRLDNRKLRNTPRGKLSSNVAGAIRKALHGSKAGRHWEDLVGYTIDQLKAHLEKLFKLGMTWENYGIAWEIDHKIPIAAFNFETPEHVDFKLCWSIRNLQPLAISRNRSKSKRIDRPFQPSLAINER